MLLLGEVCGQEEGKERLDFKCRSFCLPTEERMEVSSVFLVARNFRRRYTLRRQTVFDWKFRVPCFYVEVAFADALLNSPVSTVPTRFTDVFLLQILVADTPRRTCQNIRQHAHVRSKLRTLY